MKNACKMRKLLTFPDRMRSNFFMLTINYCCTVSLSHGLMIITVVYGCVINRFILLETLIAYSFVFHRLFQQIELDYPGILAITVLDILVTAAQRRSQDFSTGVRNWGHESLWDTGTSTLNKPLKGEVQPK